jgi:hypothetical protein
MKTELVYLKSLFGVVKAFLSIVFFISKNKMRHPSGMTRLNSSAGTLLRSGQQWQQ